MSHNKEKIVNKIDSEMAEWGQVFGLVVKMPVRMPTSQMQCVGMSPDSVPNPASY